jgi:hypothetical protein
MPEPSEQPVLAGLPVGIYPSGLGTPVHRVPALLPIHGEYEWIGDPSIMKKTRITGIVVLTLFAAGLSPTRARAAAPLSITTAGTPRKWNNSKPIAISFDLGPFNPLSKSAPDQVDAKGQQLILKAFQQWTSIDTAKVSVAANTDTPDLGQDVNGSNVFSYLNGVPPDVNPIIFDADGSVT